MYCSVYIFFLLICTNLWEDSYVAHSLSALKSGLLFFVVVLAAMAGQCFVVMLYQGFYADFEFILMPCQVVTIGLSI